ncbi:hypothetical protein BDR06DRAFT_229880 [Suillus hirtellus]|nr:hypothetical protein BDR06DRAFT_229880 [Suillus hirtellus]
MLFRSSILFRLPFPPKCWYLTHMFKLYLPHFAVASMLSAHPIKGPYEIPESPIVNSSRSKFEPTRFPGPVHVRLDCASTMGIRILSLSSIIPVIFTLIPKITIYLRTLVLTVRRPTH